MIRLFASDLDGTLLGALHDVNLPVRAAIREVTDAVRTLPWRRAVRFAGAATLASRAFPARSCAQTEPSCSAAKARSCALRRWIQPS